MSDPACGGSRDRRLCHTRLGLPAQQDVELHPGQKWDSSRPVKVRLLGDSVPTTSITSRTGSTLIDLARLDADVRAVIDLYNAIPGSSLVLELESGDHRRQRPR